MKRRISNEDREISLIELFWYILGKWKWLLAGIIAGALLLGGFGVYKDYDASRNNTGSSADELLKGFSEEKQAMIQAAVELNNTYKDMNENINVNYLMQLNPDNLVKSTLQYYVDTEYKVNLSADIENDYTAEIIDMYILMVDGYDVCRDVMELGISNLEINDIDYIVVTSVNEGIFKVVVCADEGDCEKITEVIKTRIEQYYNSVSECIGEHKISLVNENYIHTYSDYIRNAQTTRRNLLKAYSDNLTAAKKNFSATELDVYNRIVTGQNTTATVKEFKFSINMKYLILGVLGGAFAVIFIAVMAYMFGSRLRSLSEVGQIYHIDLIGKVTLKQNIFNAKRNKIQRDRAVDTQIEYIVKTIEAECRQKDISSVMLCTNVKIDTAITDAIIKGLKKAEIDVGYGTSIATDTETLNGAINRRNSIFIEQLDVSERKAIEEEIEICDRLNINILGMIVII